MPEVVHEPGGGEMEHEEGEEEGAVKIAWLAVDNDAGEGNAQAAGHGPGAVKIGEGARHEVAEGAGFVDGSTASSTAVSKLGGTGERVAFDCAASSSAAALAPPFQWEEVAE